MKKLMTMLFTMGCLIGVSVTFAEGGYHCQDQTGNTCWKESGKGTLSCNATTGSGCHGCATPKSCYMCECQ